MKKTLAALVIAFPALTQPLQAQDGYAPPPADSERAVPDRRDDDDLGSLLERGAEGLLRDLFADVEPHMDAIGRELSLRMDELAPVFEDLGKMMDDIGNYQAPERLANGDILIRRKPGAPPPPAVSKRLQDLVEPSPDMDPRRNPDYDANPQIPPAPQTGVDL